MYWYDRFLAIQGLLFNLIFACVAAGLHFWLLPTAAEAMEFRTLRYLLGGAILIGLVLEPFALRVKFRETLRDIHGGVLGDRDEDTGPRSLGLVLASIGLYAVVAFAVARRSREIGIRMALGARSQQVVSSIARGVAGLVGVGTGIGLFLTVLLMLVLRTSSGSADIGIGSMTVYRPTIDPLALLAIAAVTAVVGVLAAFVPARRAVRMHPLTALRHE